MPCFVPRFTTPKLQTFGATAPSVGSSWFIHYVSCFPSSLTCALSNVPRTPFRSILNSTFVLFSTSHAVTLQEWSVLSLCKQRHSKWLQPLRPLFVLSTNLLIRFLPMFRMTAKSVRSFCAHPFLRNSLGHQHAFIAFSRVTESRNAKNFGSAIYLKSIALYSY